MKSLAELAEEYREQAEHLKSKIDAIPKYTDDYALKRKRAILESMYFEALGSYRWLRDYYKK